ncbi:MAG: hypothetical protein WD009_12470 [Phycisphaeraceae bacterium]
MGNGRWTMRRAGRPRAKARSAARVRGSVYLAVLGASMLVTLLGVSAVLAVRIQGREAEAARTAATARYYAQSAVELALLETRQNPDWANDGDWRPQIEIGRGWLTYRFETDGAGLNDENATVWIVGRGGEGTAERLTRVAARRRSTLPGANWLENTDMSQGTVGWTLFQDLDDDLEYTTVSRTRGVGSLMVHALDGPVSGMVQKIAPPMRSGEPLELATDVRVRDDEVRIVRLGVHLTLAGGAQQMVAATFMNVGQSWERVGATLTPTWTGEVVEARWIVLMHNNAGAMLVDDVMIRPTRYRHELVPVPGTWGQEVY